MGDRSSDPIMVAQQLLTQSRPDSDALSAAVDAMFESDPGFSGWQGQPYATPYTSQQLEGSKRLEALLPLVQRLASKTSGAIVALPDDPRRNGFHDIIDNITENILTDAPESFDPQQQQTIHMQDQIGQKMGGGRGLAQMIANRGAPQQPVDNTAELVRQLQLRAAQGR